MQSSVLQPQPLTHDNFDHKVLVFRERQAGVSVIYDPQTDTYSYNAYCMENKLIQELYSCEFDFLQDALDHINGEFGTWELFDMAKKEGCGSCVAK